MKAFILYPLFWPSAINVQYVHIVHLKSDRGSIASGSHKLKLCYSGGFKTLKSSASKALELRSRNYVFTRQQLSQGNWCKNVYKMR